MARPGVTAAIVNFNTRDLLKRCLDSLDQERVEQILVIDNASTDGSPDEARLRPGVRCIANTINVGYGAAANQAVAEARTEYVLLLNADTEVRPGAVALLAEYLDAHPEVAVAAPRLENVDGTTQLSCFPFPGTLGWLLENKPLALWTRHVAGARERSVSFRTGLDPRPVPWALGAALLLRRSAIRAVDAFEESYFMYFEEVDLCHRLAQAGWTTHVVPRAVVMHEGGGSTSQVRRAMLIQRFRSTREYYRRHANRLNQFFWTTLLRARWAGRLIRDSVKLALTLDPDRRRHLRKERATWTAALFERPPEPGSPPSGPVLPDRSKQRAGTGV